MILDRRVTLALIFALAMETAGGLIWAGQASQRLADVERNLMAQSALTERIARLEEKANDMRAALVRIERALENSRGRR